MGKQSFFQATEKEQRELQALGGVESHQSNPRAFVICVGIADQRRMIEKLIQSLAPVARIHGRVHEFAQVLNPRISLGCIFLFKLLDVTGAIDKELEDLGCVRRLARSAKAWLSRSRGGAGAIARFDRDSSLRGRANLISAEVE